MAPPDFQMSLQTLFYQKAMNLFQLHLDYKFKTIKNIALIGVGISLCIALINTLISLGYVTWANIQGYSTYSLLIEELITFFLYFEFIALIVKYFKNNFHFPLDFFLYIGITAIVRLLIIDHEPAFDNLIWSVAIFVLVCSLVLVEKFIGHNE